MSDSIDMKDVASGIAALSICESLLLALSDLKIMRSSEASGILQDAAALHRNSGATGDQATLHIEVATIIERIIVDSNTARGRR